MDFWIRGPLRNLKRDIRPGTTNSGVLNNNMRAYDIICIDAILTSRHNFSVVIQRNHKFTL